MGVSGQDFPHGGRQGVKKNRLKPWQKKTWCIGKISSAFLWRMEAILHLDEQPYEPQRPVLCFDERPCQLLEDILMPIPMQPGKPKRQDYHYQRTGVCYVLIAFEPLKGRRFVRVYKQRTRKEYSQFMTELVELFYQQADTILRVQDNLHTHCPGSFYEMFKPEEAFALAQRFERHYTPQKARWLNLVEIELSVLTKQCVDRHIGDIQTLQRAVEVWAQQRNAQQATVAWRFTKNKAREKFQRCYAINQN